MQTIGPEELKKIQIELLDAFDVICRKENLRYSLGGGTLLGAVRHQGYIPWDDDIDVMMPRPDYDKFIAICLEQDVPFGLLSFETNKNYVDLSAKIYRRGTVIEDNAEYLQTTRCGVNIDIFPIEGLANDYESAKKVFRKTSFKRNLLIAAQWKKFSRSKTKAWYYEPFRLAFYLAGKMINKSKTFEAVQKVYKKIDFDEVGYVAAVGGAYREKEILPKELYADYIDLIFEGKPYKAIGGYDRYLSSIYGNYMQLPPEGKRVSHHTFHAYYEECK